MLRTTGELDAAIQSWTWRQGKEPIEQAIQFGPAGIERLAREIMRRSDVEQLILVRAIGNVQADLSTCQLDALSEAARNGDRDTRCAALVSLVKRAGIASARQLVTALSDRNRTVQTYAGMGLAYVAYTYAWDEVFSRWNYWMTHPSRYEANIPEEAVGFAYLIENAASDLEVRQVTDRVRRSWGRLRPDVRHVVLTLWPEVLDAIGNDDPLHHLPKPDEMRAWIAAKLSDLFEPEHPRY